MKTHVCARTCVHAHTHTHQNIQSLWDNIKTCNICIIRISEREKTYRGAKWILEEIMTKNFPNFLPIAEERDLKFPAITVYWSISYFNSINFGGSHIFCSYWFHHVVDISIFLQIFKISKSSLWNQPFKI